MISDHLEETRDDLYDQIRKIRDTFGDDKCWKDWTALFAMLPEGYKPPKQDIAVELTNCERYLKCQHEGTEYIPPPRWIKGLPDKPGVWVLTTDDGYRFTITYRGGAFHIKDAKIYWSFGPIPREPECLSKNASSS